MTQPTDPTIVKPEPTIATTKKPAKPKKQSRADRWADAVSRAKDAASALRARLEACSAEFETLQAAMSDLNDLKDEYEEWQGNLPEGLASSPVGEKLEAVTSIDGIDNDQNPVESALEELTAYDETLDECENADLPQGFGRD